jgi:hypothetical protein
LDHGLHVLKPRSAKPCSKNAGQTSKIVLWLTASEKAFQHPAIQTQIEQHFGGFFHQIKVRQPIGRQDSMQTAIRTAGGWIHFCMKRLRTFQYLRVKLKNQKPIAVDVLFKT